MPELNPSSEVLTQLRDHWQKVLVMVMKKHGLKEVTIDLEDMQAVFGADGGRRPFLVACGRKQVGPHGGFTLILCENQAEALEVIAKHQGRG